MNNAKDIKKDNKIRKKDANNTQNNLVIQENCEVREGNRNGEGNRDGEGNRN